MHKNYQDWLHQQNYNPNTVQAQLYRAGRVEEYYGDLDAHFKEDGLADLIQIFIYSADDQRRNRPNPTLIPFKGATYGNMKGYQFSVRLYRKFCLDNSDGGDEKTEIRLRNEGLLEKRKQRVASMDRASASDESISGTLAYFEMNGLSALASIIASSQYRTLEQALASLTMFAHPETVSQTKGRSIFRTIRGPRTPGVYSEEGGVPVMLDDNKSASDAFKWAHGIKKFKDIQFNHVYADSKNVDIYTSLANICVTPAFMAKLTDSSSAAISGLLKYRVFDLYGWTPDGIEPPNKPEGYDQLKWAPTLPPVVNLKATLEAAISTKSQDRTVKSISVVGWLFSDDVQGG